MFLLRPLPDASCALFSHALLRCCVIGSRIQLLDPTHRHASGSMCMLDLRVVELLQGYVGLYALDGSGP